MNIKSFKYRVLRKLESEGFRVHPIWNDNHRCPFDLISVNPKGKVAGVKCKQHGHLSKEEKEELLWYDMPMYVSSEKYSGGSSEVHEIKIERLEKL
jgi:hypothetical protein